MPQREPPSVLLVSRDSASRVRIAAMLEEAGIAVTAAEGGGAALAAAARSRFNLAIVAAGPSGWPDAAGLAEAIRARHPNLELLSIDDAACLSGADSGEPRWRLVGCVRDRLTCAGGGERNEDEAEAAIALAQIACLHRRREAAHASGAHRLAGELRRQIDRVAEHHRNGGSY